MTASSTALFDRRQRRTRGDVVFSVLDVVVRKLVEPFRHFVKFRFGEGVAFIMRKPGGGFLGRRQLCEHFSDVSKARTYEVVLDVLPGLTLVSGRWPLRLFVCFRQSTDFAGSHG